MLLPVPKTEKGRWKLVFIILYSLCAFTVVLGLLALRADQLNGDRVDDIQSSRVQNTYNNCEEQNARNENTIAVFDKRIAEGVKSGELKGQRLQRARESRAFTVGLIGALAPHQNCLQLVRTRFGAEADTVIEK